MSEERLTEELLERLLASATPESYLAGVETEDRDLAQYLGDLLADKGLTRADAIRAAAINATHGYQAFQGTRKLGRDNAIKLAFGMRCTLRETQRLLRFAGAAELWAKQRRDAIIIHCIERGLTREETDDELFRLGEPTLLPEDF